MWVDETGADRRDQIRKFGYALKGLTPVYHRPLVRGTRVSSITGMCSEGIVDYKLTDSTVNADRFFDFVRRQLIPNMQPFPGNQSIIIMDNCTVHHSQELKEFIQSARILLLFLPPYSPDFKSCLAM